MRSIKFKALELKVVNDLSARPGLSGFHVKDDSGEEWVLKVADVSHFTENEALHLVDHFKKVFQLTPSFKTKTIDLELNDHFFYFLKPFVPGISLADLTVKPTYLQIVRMALLALRQLSALHDCGLLHGDIKPSNVIVSSDCEKLYLIDHAFLDPKPHLQKSSKSRIIGTVAYSAPEQTGLIPRVVDQRADLYSLGIVLLELLTGKRAFPGPTMGDIFKQQILHQPRLELFGGNIPPALAECILRLCRLDPGDRYQSVRAAQYDFERIEEILVSGQIQKMIEIGKMDVRKEVTDPPFIGRQEHLDKLTDLLSKIEQNGCLVRVTGYSGVGKSSLLSRLQSEALQKEIMVIKGQGVDEGARTPLGVLRPFIHYMSSLLKEDDILRERFVRHMDLHLESLCLVAPVFAELFGVRPEKKIKYEEFGEARTIQALHQLLFFAEHLRTPLVLILDDCQWADDLSVKIIRSWSMESEKSKKLMILMSYRAEESASQPLLASIEVCEQVRIESFDYEDVKKIITAMVGDLPAKVCEDVFLISQGNPFMIGSLLRGLVESKSVIYEDGSWQINYDSYGDIKSSAKSASYLIQRLELLGTSELELLTLGAILGKEFSILDISRIAEIEPSQVLLMVKNAAERQLIWISVEKQKIIFIHDKIREALLIRLSAKERRSLHRRCAEVYERNPDRRHFELSYHYSQAGDLKSAFPYAVESAREARFHFSIPIALQQYEIAERGLAAKDQNLENEILQEHAELLMLHGHYSKSRERFQKVLERVEDLYHQAHIYEKLGDIEFKSGHLEVAARDIEKGLNILGVSVPKGKFAIHFYLCCELLRQTLHTILYPILVANRKNEISELENLRCRLLSRLTYIFWFSKGSVFCMWSHLRGMNDAETYAPSEALAQSYSEHSPVVSMLPWHSRGVKYVSKALEIRQAMGNEWGVGQAYHFLGVSYYSAAKYDDCIESCRQAVQLMKKVGDQWEINTANWHIAYCFLRKGDYKKALELAERIYEAAKEIGDVLAEGVALAVKTKCLFGQVDVRDLDELLAKGASDYHLRVELLIAKALYHLHRREWDSALTELESAEESIREKGLRNAYVAPTKAYKVTALRMALLSDPPKDLVKFRSDLKQAIKVAHQTVRFSKSYCADLPHALRELAILQAVNSQPKRALKNFLKAKELAKSHGAWFEYHKTVSWMCEFQFSSDTESQNWIFALKNQMSLNEDLKIQRELSFVDRYSNIIQMGAKLFKVENESSVFTVAKEAISSLFRIGDFHLFRVSEDGAEPQGVSGISGHLWKKAVTEKRAVLQVGDSQKRSAENGLSEANSKLYAPIQVNNRLYGGFGLESNLHSLYTEEDLSLANFVASLVGASLQNVLLLSEQRNLNLDLTRTVNELENHRLKLEIAKREAESGNLAKSQFLAAISHDLRTPLTAIKGFAELISEEDVEQTEFLKEKIVTNSDRLLSLINELLDFSRAESGSLDINIEKFDLFALLDDIEGLMHPLCAPKGNNLLKEVAEDTPRWLIGDGKRIEQILINLIGNSVKFCEHGEIFLTVAWEDVTSGKGLLSFEVKDQGLGISAEFHDKIFENFFQVDQSNLKKAGTGLGLPLAKKLARSMGGDLFLEESDLGRGSRFIFQVPCSMALSEIKIEEKKKIKESRTTFDAIKVLVVEDVLDNQILLGIYLNKIGCEVTFAINGEEALSLCEKENFDVILMDIQMPVMDGWKAIQSLKERGNQTPVIVVSANAGKEDCLQGLKTGCQGYLTKPIDFSHIKEHLEIIDFYLVKDHGINKVKCWDSLRKSLDKSEAYRKLKMAVQIGKIEEIRVYAEFLEEYFKNEGILEAVELAEKIKKLSVQDNHLVCLINVYLNIFEKVMEPERERVG